MPGALKIKVGGTYQPVTRGEPGPSGHLTGESKIWNGPRLPAGGFLWEDGAAHSRVTYDALFRALTIQPTANTVNGTPTLSNVTFPDGSAWGDLATGWPVSGPGVPPSTKVSSINIGAGTITLDKNLTSSSTGATFVIAPHGVGDGSTTFNVPDKRVRVPIGEGTGFNLGDTDGALEYQRSVEWLHDHSHPVTGTISGNATGVYVNPANTDHNHPGPADHGQGTNPNGTNNTRLGPGAGHGSTGLAAQSTGQSHAHGLVDPWHAHDHSLGTAAYDTGLHPFAVVNYIIKT